MSKWQVDQYNLQHSRYENRAKSFSNFNKDINTKPKKRHLYLIRDNSTPQARLGILNKHFAPTNSTRQDKISQSFHEFKELPRAASKLGN